MNAKELALKLCSISNDFSEKVVDPESARMFLNSAANDMKSFPGMDQFISTANRLSGIDHMNVEKAAEEFSQALLLLASGITLAMVRGESQIEMDIDNYKPGGAEYL